MRFVRTVYTCRTRGVLAGALHVQVNATCAQGKLSQSCNCPRFLIPVKV